MKYEFEPQTSNFKLDPDLQYLPRAARAGSSRDRDVDRGERPGGVAPQQTPPQPIFTAGTDLVEVQAVVTDKKGGVVRGLSREDFQVTEDGRPQDVLTFGFVDIPWTPPAPAAAGEPTVRAAAASDVATNVMPHERRVYVLVLDGFNVDSTRSPNARKLARQFIAESIGPNDLTAVLLFGNNKANQPFTTDKALLNAAVDQFIGEQKSRIVRR